MTKSIQLNQAINTILTKFPADILFITDIKDITYHSVITASSHNLTLVMSTKDDLYKHYPHLTDIKIACPNTVLCIIGNAKNTHKIKQCISDKLSIPVFSYPRLNRRCIRRTIKLITERMHLTVTSIDISYGEVADRYITRIMPLITPICNNPPFWAQAILSSDKRELYKISSKLNYDILSDRRISHLLSEVYSVCNDCNISLKSSINNKKENFLLL